MMEYDDAMFELACFDMDNNIDSKDVLISHGCALLRYKIKDKTNDIDIAVPDKVFNTLSEKYMVNSVKVIIKGKEIIKPFIKVGNIEVHCENEVDKRKKFVMVDGYKFTTVDQCLIDYLDMSRLKDHGLIMELTKMTYTQGLLDHDLSNRVREYCSEFNINFGLSPWTAIGGVNIDV